MKVCLIFPPDYNSLWMPYGATPSLAAFLQQAGVDVEQCDWNIEIYNELLTADGINRLWESTRWEEDREASYPGVPNRSELAARLKPRVPDIAAKIEDSVGLFRSKSRFKLNDEYFAAKAVYDDAMVLIAAAAWDIEEVLKSPQKALDAALDPAVNPYLPFIEKKVAAMMAGKPGVVGLSVNLPRQMVPALAIATLVKKADPKVHVVLGGAYPTMTSTAIENSPELFKVIDSVVLSEGEVGLLAVVRAVENGASAEEAPGILFLNKDGKVALSSLPVMIDADELPTMSFDDLPLDKYLSPEPILPAMSSRGCYWRKCSFCARPDRKGYSQRSEEKIAKDLAHQTKKYGARTFHFHDNAIRPRRLSSIGTAIVEAGIEILWTARTRFGPEITPEWAERVASSGLVRIILGMESASKRILDLMQKGFKPEEISPALQSMSKAGIDVTLYLMIGFPSETEEEAGKTVAFIEKYRESLTPYAHFYLSPFGVAAGSPIEKDRIAFSIKNMETRGSADMRNPYCFEFEANAGMTRNDVEKLYLAHRDKLAALSSRAMQMPHDMLARRKEYQVIVVQKREKVVLRMDSIPRLAEDLRVDKGYLKKGEKKFRIDENLGALIDVLDSRKNLKQALTEFGKSRSMNLANAFIFAQQLFEEGVIDVTSKN